MSLEQGRVHTNDLSGQHPKISANGKRIHPQRPDSTLGLTGDEGFPGHGSSGLYPFQGLGACSLW